METKRPYDAGQKRWTKIGVAVHPSIPSAVYDIYQDFDELFCLCLRGSSPDENSGGYGDLSALLKLKGMSDADATIAIPGLDGASL